MNTLARNGRIAAIDLLRGLAVIGMILVAYAGDWDHRFPVLTHADWRGFALADMIFPSFLFCVGAAMPFSLLKRAGELPIPDVLRYLARRSAALFALGLLLNLLPDFDFGHVRIMGILQRIGMCYFAAGMLALLLGRRTAAGFELAPRSIALAAAALALAYGGLLWLWDAPDCGRGCFDSAHALPTVIDRALLGVPHIWPYGTTAGSVTYEPEGLLSTSGALINVLIGLLAGLVLQAGDATAYARWLKLGLMGAALLVLGFALDPAIPVVKKIWTPSFALMSSGFSLLALLVLKPISATWRLSPVQAFGANATLAFIGISLLDCVLQLPLRAAAPRSWHDRFAIELGNMIADARVASVAYSAALAALLGAALLLLYRRRLFFKL